LRPAIFCQTVGDLEAEAVINTIHYSQAEVKAQTLVDFLRDVKAKASANTLANMVAVVKAFTEGCEGRVTRLNAPPFARRS